MSHVQFDPESVKIEQFFQTPAPPKEQEGTGDMLQIKTTGASAPVTKRELPALNPPEAVVDVEKRDPKRIKRVERKPIKGRKPPSKTVVLKPEKVEGRLCSAALPVRKQRSDALGFY